MDLLRFFTAGNVDDGKSTLIGRLLFDSNSISTDIIETLTRQSKTKGADTNIDLALLTDGLRAEREQGITIDVAYKYFNTEKRKFIIADTPGHIQYTRNMFTGASNADLAIILVDARNGITEQTKRHSIISSILNIPEIIVCVNKMDLVDYSRERFLQIISEFSEFGKDLKFKNITFIPVSALEGDNVVKPTNKMKWYIGSTLLQYLENVKIDDESESQVLSRFQVQYIIRPQTSNLHDYRGYAGKIFSGSFHVGQKVVVLPAGIETEISQLENSGVEVGEVNEGDAAVIHLKDDIDISRGNTIVPAPQLPQSEKEINALICWMDDKAFVPGQKLLLQQNTFRTKAAVKSIDALINIHTLEELESTENLKLNDIAKLRIKLAEELFYDSYKTNRSTGSFILINENTNNTVAAGVLY